MTSDNTPTHHESLGTTLRAAVLLFLLLSVVTGLLYPLLLTGAAQTLFPHQANGSLIQRDGKPVGSALIGQAFTEPGHFWGRPSATGPTPYNAAASGGSNLGPTSQPLQDAVRERIAALRAADPGNSAPVPVDLVTASASGLDPHISLAAAQYQIKRVARARGLAPDTVQALVDRHARRPLIPGLGEPRVNVLALNLAIDAAATPVR
ncbi:MAG: potassium-transporting ATPase subunit KdpC [Hydrogenophaga sp.]|uniref:potassium-transporting ATPase subunit KdpC n=1 Tax=Hydrogenophaga sp. TaxID=1904254 RepID=UPI001692132B|nr:potassium-transporting ATPase subunit KdpC [Hydrogenophaga sp.]NIM42212.1 potassium-transporting ATPase subunit KdpC [Hydrogenophaga sp.]NIN27944.1 potassium-transporting ATPase subunit KdpC [Hydrogenophaga sp.]NIN32722.1 potassium-transporting ATPase subunit KdpC [Hydrogenophaga sp.]NIN54611.1 potassium-transporting ATPase subunit KdpC [Hydrogenophaga sp.]NIO51287.1 potassium-transporting ATPase subunit KdpC [Hydrogenophaga sp.]